MASSRAPHRIARIVAVAGTVLILTAACQFLIGLLGSAGAQLLWLEPFGLSSDAMHRARARGTTLMGALQDLPWERSDRGTLIWAAPGIYLRSLRLELPAQDFETLAGVVVVIGGKPHFFARQELLERWSPTKIAGGCVSVPGADLVVLESPHPGSGSGWLSQLTGPLLNGPVDPFRDGGPADPATWLTWPLTIASGYLLLALALRWLWFRPVFAAWLEGVLGFGRDPRDGDPADLTRRRDRLWLASALAVVLIALIRLQIADPYWFTQDDNRVQFLPNILFGARAAVGGELPLWNPHENLGAPVLEPGHYPFTYPVTYLCYGLAKVLLGQECLTLQVWAWLHLLAACAAAYALSRVAGVAPPLAASVAVAHAVSGYVLAFGRAWPYGTGFALWFPLCLLPLALMRERRPGAGLVLATGVLVGMTYHSGNAQSWLYTLISMGAFAAPLAFSSRTRGRAAWLVAGLLLGGAIAAPLLVPQLLWATNLERAGGVGLGILPHFAALLVPACAGGPFVPDDPAARGLFLTGMFYVGTILPAVGFAALLLRLGSPASRRGHGRVPEVDGWLAGALATLLLALGNEGFVWPFLSRLPGLSMLNFPFKLLPFLGLFLGIAGALTLGRVPWRRETRTRLEAAVFLATATLTLCHASPSLHPVTEWSIPVPYPELDRSLGGVDGPLSPNSGRRIFPLAQSWNGSIDNLGSLSFSLPTWYGVFSADGYNPAVHASSENARAARRFIADPIEAARQYGVGWFLQRHAYRPPTELYALSDSVHTHTSKLDSFHLLAKVRSACRLVVATGSPIVWEVPDPRPMAFTSQDPDRALPVRFGSTGATVETSSLPEGATVVVNVLARTAMRARTDGRELPIRPDPWDRVTVDVPAGTRRLEVSYEPRVGLGAAVGLMLAALSGLLTWLLARRRPGD